MSAGLFAGVNSMRTGTRWRTLTKLPAELSWGMRAREAPVAVEMDFTTPAKVTPGMASTVISTRLPTAIWRSCVSL